MMMTWGAGGCGDCEEDRKELSGLIRGRSGLRVPKKWKYWVGEEWVEAKGTEWVTAVPWI